jgi:hypothetical protein
MKLEAVIAVVCAVAFAGLLLFQTPGQFATLLAGAVVLIAILRWPIFGLVLFGFAATFVPFMTVQIGLRTTASEAILAFIWLGVAWQFLLGRRLPAFGPTERMVIYLMLFSALPFIVGEWMIYIDPHPPITIGAPVISSSNAGTPSGIVNWARWLIDVSCIFLVPLLIDSERKRDAVIAALLLGNFAMLGLSLTLFLRNNVATDIIPVLDALKYAHPELTQHLFKALQVRLGTTWLHPNLSAGEIVMFLPLAMYYAGVYRGWRRWLGGSVALMGLVGIMLTGSRGALLSVVAILGVFAVLRVPGTRKTLIAAAVFGTALVSFYPAVQSRLSQTFSARNESTEVRMEEYREFPRVMATYPLGIGFKVDPPVPGSGLIGISNLWLNYVYKLGLFGALLYCAVLLRWWREVRPRGAVRVVDHANGVWLASFGGLGGALVTGLFDHYYSFTMVLIALFWLMMGINLQAARALPQVGAVERRMPMRRVFAARTS